MKSGIKNQTLAFGGLEFFFWAGNCCVIGFLSSYLKQIGYADPTIGLVMAIVAVVLIASQPLFGYIADTYIPPKILISVSIFLGIGAAFLIPLSRKGFVYAMLTVLLLTVCESSVTGVISSWSSKLIALGEPINYGLSRGMGSMGFAFTALLVGNMMQRFGPDVIFILHAMFYAIDVLIIVFLVKSVPCMNTKGKSAHNESSLGFSGSMMVLLKNKKYVVLMLTLFLTSCAISVVGTYYPVILLASGGTNTDIGLALFVTAFSEGCVMVFYSRFAQRFKNSHILLFSLIFFVIRFLLFWLASGNTRALIVCQATQSFSYGLYLPSTVAHTADISPLSLRSTALSVGMAVNFGISCVVGNLMGSALSQSLGLTSIFPVAFSMTLVGIMIFSLTFFIKDHTPENQVVLK